MWSEFSGVVVTKVDWTGKLLFASSTNRRQANSATVKDVIYFLNPKLIESARTTAAKDFLICKSAQFQSPQTYLLLLSSTFFPFRLN